MSEYKRDIHNQWLFIYDSVEVVSREIHWWPRNKIVNWQVIW